MNEKEPYKNGLNGDPAGPEKGDKKAKESYTGFGFVFFFLVLMLWSLMHC
jgi:hypothetical protein